MPRNLNDSTVVTVLSMMVSFPRKTVNYVSRECKQLRKKSDVYHYIDALSLKVTTPNLLAAVGVLIVNPK